MLPWQPEKRSKTPYFWPSWAYNLKNTGKMFFFYIYIFDHLTKEKFLKNLKKFYRWDSAVPLIYANITYL